MSAVASVDADLARVVRQAGFASIAAALAPGDGDLSPPRWDDPVRVGDRVHLSLRHIAATMEPIGRAITPGTFTYGGVEATTGGRVTALDGDAVVTATVEWDDGRVQQLAAAALMQSDLRQFEAIRFHAGEGQGSL